MNNQCRYCQVAVGQNHTPNCPIMDVNPEWAKKEWQTGYDRGFNDDFAPRRFLSHYSPHFQRGYQMGSDEIDRLVENAESDRYHGIGEREY